MHVGLDDGQHFVPVVGVEGYTSAFQRTGHVAEVSTLFLTAQEYKQDFAFLWWMRSDMRLELPIPAQNACPL
jgi:hypothetical protein